MEKIKMRIKKRKVQVTSLLGIKARQDPSGGVWGMRGPFARLFMHCVERAHWVLRPMNDDADFLHMQHTSIILQVVLFLKQKNPMRKVLTTVPILFWIFEYSVI
jgi:hypothetical protein